MKAPTQFEKIYLYRNPVDFRKSINGLSSIVQEEMKLNAFTSALFIFCCARRKRIKILYWDRTGFALWLKRLEEDLFPWPKDLEDETVEISARELEWVLDGINIWKIKPHEEKKYSKTC
jgi:transposase